MASSRGIGINVTVPVEILNMLERRAKLIHRSVPEVIRRFVEMGLAEDLQAAAEAK
jgi:hypothetical protein